MSIIIGLTGGIGSGKTTVANLFAAKGIQLIDADLVARELVAPNSECFHAIVDHFGLQILRSDGTLNRLALREHIFANPHDKDWLNQLLHPKIQQEMLAQARVSQSHYCLWVAPLLIENQLQQFCRRVLVVDVAESLQISRTCQRDHIDRKLVKKMLISQLSRADRLAYADDIIHNDTNLEALNAQVNVLHEQYLLLSTQNRHKKL